MNDGWQREPTNESKSVWRQRNIVVVVVVIVVAICCDVIVVGVVTVAQ